MRLGMEEASPRGSALHFDRFYGQYGGRVKPAAGGAGGAIYFKRRTSPYDPEVSLLDIERRMGFPRDYLEFTAWYLRNKGYITLCWITQISR